MSDQEIVESYTALLEAVKKEDIKQCGIPIPIYIQESKNLHKRATLDLAKLTAVGFNAELLTKLSELTTILVVSEVNWQEESSESKIAANDWKKNSPEMYSLNSELIDSMEFAYRKDDQLLSLIDAIKEGDNQADAVLDLSKLAKLGKDNPEPLMAMNFDLTKLDKAVTLSKSLSETLSIINGHAYVEEHRKEMRDKAFTLLKEVVDEVYEYGRFVFRNDADHVKAYGSKYKRDRAAAYQRSKKEKQE
ncbi:hypothetical protein [Saccharicrinis aurantiacus]|uniref:hypothetical protein n=1 Tax=Saccharicrinis aurantiacus TaxID=1849719 RepID=UPI0024906F61|nr:hypothetical protein [Saccharicrinis aurantiacus]